MAAEGLGFDHCGEMMALAGVGGHHGGLGMKLEVEVDMAVGDIVLEDIADMGILAGSLKVEENLLGMEVPTCKPNQVVAEVGGVKAYVGHLELVVAGLEEHSWFRFALLGQSSVTMAWELSEHS